MDDEQAKRGRQTTSGAFIRDRPFLCSVIATFFVLRVSMACSRRETDRDKVEAQDSKEYRSTDEAPMKAHGTWYHQHLDFYRPGASTKEINEMIPQSTRCARAPTMGELYLHGVPMW